MMGLPLAFAQPLVLLGLLSLPVLWWLLRLIPPRPKRVEFPPTRLLFDIVPKEDTPARTPWWLTALRLTLAALVILAAAGPLWNPPVTTSSGASTVALLIDDGWAAAATWDERMRTAEDIIARAETDNRGVVLVPLSEPARDLSVATAGAARVRLKQLKPKPHTVDRVEIIPAIARLVQTTPAIEFVWLSDGIDLGHGSEFVAALGRTVEGRPITVIAGGLRNAHALVSADNAAGGLMVKILRAGTGTVEQGLIRALDLKGLPLGETRYSFGASARETDAEIDLPVEIRNDIARLEIASERSAGAVQLLDKRWRRRTVGVVSGATAETAQPLLASTYYIGRALNPFADVRLAEGTSPAEAVRRFLEQNLPMLILADVGNVTGEARERLAAWIENGGVLVRFAGPRLAAADDDLVPVKLRRGGRILGGSLTWEQPQPLASFSRDSPFHGMVVPEDVKVSRQVLAEPGAGLTDRTWVALADGTPLVTAARRGKGMIVLFHVTADTRWSDLPLSGAFVEMLKRIVALAGSTTVTESAVSTATVREMIAPSRILDGFGAFGPPPPTARPVPANYAGRATAENPPGFYGPPEGLLAVNTLAPTDRISPLDFSPLGARVEAFRVGEPHDLRGPVLLLAFLLLMIDGMVVFWLSGGIGRLMRWRRRAAAAMIFAALTLPASPPRADAQERPQLQLPPQLQQLLQQRIRTPNVFDWPPGTRLQRVQQGTGDEQLDFAMRATLETRLAYVITGDAEVDAISQSGLRELTIFLANRTALEAGDPIGVDIARDELAFFPLLYWPIVPGAPTPSPAALARIDAFMKGGGTVLFDTRDAIMAPPGPGGESRSPGMLTLRAILSSLDIPELEPVPRDHVLTKTFYLLRDFPGRFNTGQLWVEATPTDNENEDEKRPARPGDGVSSIIITSNDLAGAWAARPDGQAMLPLVPGEPRQREFAFRAGVNIVMYALTGNYKADQVHVPALLERLGQ
ncbi:MAG TPA: DUF4159 domain-containing protein [Xanthobacteraceae bacterium]|nr:DUF4159 domain-containing protein [Xanthobacteraceae bacterium]